MKGLIQRLLRPWGLELRRIERSSIPEPDPVEIAALDGMLETFAARHPPSSPLSNTRDLRAYLSDARIAFYNGLVDVCEAEGVELSGRRVADIGTGMGYLLRVIGHRYPAAELHGYDTFTEMLDLARMLCPDAVFESESLFSVASRFDVVFCTEVLEHMVDPEEALRQLAERVQPSGTLVLTVPDGRRDRGPAKALREDGTAYWGHVNFWSPESWPLFLRRRLPEARAIDVGRLVTHKSYAVIRM